VVTHRDVDRDGCERAINALRQVLADPHLPQVERN
jgi:hypothetical protein